MRIASSLFIAASLTALPAAAQQTAESMTCAQAVATFAKNRTIYKTVNGSALPIKIGEPIAQAGSVMCRGQGVVERRYTVKTTDNPRCAVSVYCQ